MRVKLTATIVVETDIDMDDPDGQAVLEALKGGDQDVFDETLTFEGYELSGDIKVEVVETTS